MKSHQSERIFLIVMIVFYGFWVYQATILTSRKATQYDVGINFFPLVLSAGMLILTAYLLVKNVAAARKEAGESDAQEPAELEQDTKQQMLMKLSSFFVVLGLLLLYILLLRPLGFALSTLIFLMLMNTYLGRLTYGQFFRWQALLIRFVGFGIFSYGLPYIFRHVFRLILP